MTPIAFFAAVKSAYDTFREIWKVFDPDPSTEELITQAKEEIIREIENVVAHEYIAQVNALFEEYALYQVNPTDNRLGFLDTQSVLTLNYLAESINNGTPRMACLVAKAYNFLAPLRAIVMKLVGDPAEQIEALLRRVIDVNQVLIGPYRFEALPNVPVYINAPHAKIIEYYRTGEVAWNDADELIDFVWRCNEEARSETIPGYPDNVWFFIQWRGHNRFLRAAGSEVALSPLPQETDASFLWQFRFSRYDATQIVSIDQGFCLAFRPQEPGGDWGQVVLEKSSDRIRQRWRFFAWWELSRGPGIGSNAADNAYLFAAPDAETPVVHRIAYVPDGSSSWEVSPGSCAVGQLAQGTPLADRLDDLRAFRDKVLRPSPAGHRYVGMLQAHTPEILGLLVRYKSLRSAAAGALNRVAPAGLSSLTRRPKAFTAGDIAEVDRVLGKFVRHASPRLREAIDGVRRDAAKFEGRSALKGLARLDAELAAIGRARKAPEP